MRTLRAVCIAAALVAAQSIASAADVSGNWVAQVMREGHSVTVTFDFKVAGDKLTGTISSNGRPQTLVDGKVNGNNISFATVRTVEDKTYRAEYTGTLSGDELKLSGKLGEKQIVDTTAKRAK